MSRINSNSDKLRPGRYEASVPLVGMPSCAPTMGSDEEPGWAQCSMGNAKCIKCQSDPDSSCGQMMEAGGFDSVPPTCAGECCSKTGSIVTMPTDCAPTIGTDKNPGWSQCSMGHPDCVQCQPDPETDCGQMMSAGGFDSAPKACVGKCCMQESGGGGGGDIVDGDVGMSDNVKNGLKIGIGLLVLIILVLVGIKIFGKGKKGGKKIGSGYPKRK
jgi:hypothetical protein